MVDLPVLTAGEGKITPRGSHRAKARKASQDESAKHIVACRDNGKGVTLARGDKAIWEWDVG
jgi:hypothetical protein